MAESERFEVATAMTDSVEGSTVNVLINTTPICSNITNKEFRALISRLKLAAIYLVQKRIGALAVWPITEQARVTRWFGIADLATRDYLRAGLLRLLRAISEMKPENVIRWDQAAQRNITCVVPPDDGITDAGVCKPDSERRIISIYSHFCTSPEADRWHGCQLLTFIHECTHFTDVFDSTDDMYGVTVGLQYWAKREPQRALRNADSIACYVGFKETNYENE